MKIECLIKKCLYNGENFKPLFESALKTKIIKISSGGKHILTIKPLWIEAYYFGLGFDSGNCDKDSSKKKSNTLYFRSNSLNSESTHNRMDICLGTPDLMFSLLIKRAEIIYSGNNDDIGHILSDAFLAKLVLNLANIQDSEAKRKSSKHSYDELTYELLDDSDYLVEQVEICKRINIENNRLLAGYDALKFKPNKPYKKIINLFDK